MKIKNLSIFVLLLLFSSLVFPSRVGSLPEVLRPDNITIYDNELYVVEGAEISIYSLKDLSLKREFGKKGEGPGELKIVPGFLNKVAVFPDYIMVVGVDKIVFFSKEGTFIKEKKKSFLLVQVIPVGKNFVVKRNRYSEDRKDLYVCISIYSPEMEEIKELYRQKHVQQGTKLDMVMDFINLNVSEDKIFVDESAGGFVIEVFDSQGKKLYRIDKDYEKIDVTGEHKNAIIERFKEDPLIKRQIKLAGGWDELKKRFMMKFMDTYPPIQSMEISGKKIYVQTFNVKEGKSEYIVMDLKGKIIKKVYLPRFENTPLLSKLLGARLQTIYNDKLYYLMENEDEEEWELHVQEIR